MALRQHLLAVGTTPADAGGSQPTFSRGVAFRFRGDQDGALYPPTVYPAAIGPLPAAGGTAFAKLTTPDGKADRRDLVATQSGEWRPGQFGEGSRIEYLDPRAPAAVYLALVEVVDHLWEAGLPGPCPCGEPGCGNFR